MYFLKKTTLANVVGATCIILGLLYGIKEGKAELVGLIVGSAVSYFYGRYQQQQR
ncbi:MAG: hypothetical protein QXO99_08395 [Candidatus Methanomethylicia archaeon]